MAAMGLVPAGAYRNRDFAGKDVVMNQAVAEPLLDILYDPQTSGGLLIAVAEKDAAALERNLQALLPCAVRIGYVGKKTKTAIVLE